MNVNVIGPQGGIVQPDLHANIVLAVRNFAQQLGINRLKNKILVRVHNKVFMNDDGTQALCESIDQRNFVIDVCMYSNWVVNLAHEMVHVKQFARGELDSGLSSWKSNKYCANIEYWDQPWEKEARRLQFKLAEEFEKSLDA
jgi:hypothetical protein